MIYTICKYIYIYISHHFFISAVQVGDVFSAGITTTSPSVSLHLALPTALFIFVLALQTWQQLCYYTVAQPVAFSALICSGERRVQDEEIAHQSCSVVLSFLDTQSKCSSQIKYRWLNIHVHQCPVSLKHAEIYSDRGSSGFFSFISCCVRQVCVLFCVFARLRGRKILFPFCICHSGCLQFPPPFNRSVTQPEGQRENWREFVCMC